MLVTYTCSDEVLIVSDADERLMLKEYFLPTGDRDLDEYDRTEDRFDEKVVVVSAGMRARFE